ncbi:MAG: radical SAM family heme chaperone HemW [Candidatus Tectimicrobiota bacterium]
MSAAVPALGLYVHIPFCPQRCPYCAFTILTGHVDLYERYVAAVCLEIRSWQALAARGPLQTVYFGGGTPSLLAPEQVQRILAAANATLGLAPDAEITLEANPTTADAARFAAFREVGCNRLSLGVQSFHDADLHILGRWHSGEDARRAYQTARCAGFANINLDVMFSIPGVPRERWQAAVHTLLALRPEHISTYALTIEEGTRFARRHHQGRLPSVSEEDDAWAYAWVMETLEAAGYEHYEVSNFARSGYRSRHNWGYWHGADYLGVGLAAHSLLNGRRHWNRRGLRSYIEALEKASSPCEGEETLTPATARRERIWLQLRTCEGVRLEAEEQARLQAAEKFQAMLAAGWVTLTAARLHVTPAGFLLADAIGVEVLTLLGEE